MTTPAEATSVRNEIVVNAPVERAFARLHRADGQDQAARAQHARRRHRRDGVRAARRRPHLRPRHRRQRVRVGDRARLRAARPRRLQLEHQPALAGRDRPRRSAARSRCGSSPRTSSAPASSSSTATSTATATAGKGLATASPRPTAGGSTSAATPTSCEALRRAPRHHRPGGRPPPAALSLATRAEQPCTRPTVALHGEHRVTLATFGWRSGSGCRRCRRAPPW